MNLSYSYDLAGNIMSIVDAKMGLAVSAIMGKRLISTMMPQAAWRARVE